MDWILIEKDERHIARERAKAQALKRTQWWHRKRQRGICHYCGEQFPPEALTMDHIVPLSRGGRSTRGNIVPACKRCNSEKRYFTPVERVLEEL